MQIEITFTLRKNGGYMPSGLDSMSFPVDRQAGRLVGWLADKNFIV